MKKLLLLAGILVVGATSFAGGADWDSNAVEKNLRVTATVVKNLEIDTQDVKFGEVAAGMKGIAPKQNGKIEIKGEAGATVKVMLKDESGNEVGEGSVVRLWGPTSSNIKETINYHPEFSTKDYGLVNHGGYGWKDIDVEGKLDVPENTTPGEYSAVLTARVSYVKFADK
jgi:hypothetical protein